MTRAKLTRAIAVIAALLLLSGPSCLAMKMERNVSLNGRDNPSTEEQAVISLARKGQIEASLKECLNDLRKKPNDSHLKLLKAQILRFTMEDTEAEKELEELRNSKDLTGKELEAAALTSQALENWHLTKFFAEKALATVSKSESHETLYCLGDALLKLGSFEAAEKCYLDLYKIDTGSRAIDTLIYFYKIKKKPEEVVKYCSLALGRNKDSNSLTVVKHHKFRGESLAQLGRNKEALADFNYCIGRLSAESYLYRCRAGVLQKLGQDKAAQLDKIKASEIDKTVLGSDGLFGRTKD